jgi:hypothetical protein
MQVDIYKSTKAAKYLILPHGTSLQNMAVQAGFDQDLLQVFPFNTTLDFYPGDKRAGIDADNVLEQINARGYATCGATVVLTMVPQVR